MAGWRQAVELAMTGEEIETLTALSRSRTEPASRVSRAAMLPAIGRSRRSLPWDADLACIIRRSSAASSGPSPMAHWRPSTTDRDRARSRRSRRKPRPGWCRWSTAIKLILDNHSAHISRETRAWLDTRPAGRFDFTFTPKHGSWLNLIEGFFSKFARSVLRHIRVTSKHELKQRIMAGIDDVNRHPVLHTWSYKLAEAA